MEELHLSHIMKREVKISEAEWGVMGVVWREAPVTAKRILEAIGHRRDWTLATVRTLLRRLCDKGALEWSKQGKRYLYHPLLTAEECVRQESESFADRVLDKAPFASLLHMVERADLSKKDIQELRRVLRAKEGKQ
jgi:BlaI family penicillinase repressor